MMNPIPVRYEDGRALTLAGFAERFSMADLSGLPRLWQRFGPHIGHVPGAHGRDSYGVCYNPDDQGASTIWPASRSLRLPACPPASLT